MAQEQEMLKAELEDHKVAIQTLVSEEGRLQSALAHMEKEANKSQAEHEDLTSRLQASQQHSLDLELSDMKLRSEKFQQALEERSVLKGRVEHMKSVVSALRVERSTWTEKVQENQSLSLHNLEQQERLLILEKKLLEQQEEDLTLTQSLQDTSQCLEASKEEKEQLQAQLSFLALPREVKEGDKEEARAEEATPAAMTIPEAVDNPQVMQAFYIKAKSVAEVTKRKLSQQLQEQEARCQCLANLAAQCQARLEQQALFPKSRNHGPSGDRKQGTRVSKKKAKICFMQAPPDKVEHQSPVEDLQHQCSQLSKHIIALDDSIMVYKVGIEVLDKLHKEKDDCVKQLTQEKVQKKKELQELLVLLLGEGTECLGQMPALPETPAAEATSHLPGPSTTEESEEQKIFADAQLQESVQPAQAEENDELAIMTLKTCQPSWHTKKM
ncbi:golgin subfamily A member 2-like [Thomomys bottae]